MITCGMIGLDNSVHSEDQDVLNMYQVVMIVLILELISERNKVNVRKTVVYQDISLMPRLSVVKNVLLRVVNHVQLLMEKVKTPDGLVIDVVIINILLKQLIKMDKLIKLVLVSVHNTHSKETITLREVKNYLRRELMNVHSVHKPNHSLMVFQVKEEDVLKNVSWINQARDSVNITSLIRMLKYLLVNVLLDINGDFTVFVFLIV